MGETSSSAAAVRVAAGTGATRAIDLAYAAMDTAVRRGLALLRRIPLWLRLGAIALLGAAAAGVVAYEAASNPLAAPAHVAAVVRVLIIGILIAGGVYAQTSRIQLRMGALLVAAGLYSAIWLLNGSRDSVAFSLGALAAGAAPTVFSYVMLAHPSGRLGRGIERRFLLVTGGVLLATWIALILTSVQPPVRTALLQCSPHCPPNAFTVGSISGATRSLLEAGMWTALVVLMVGTAVLVQRRARPATAPVRHSLVPVSLAAWASVLAALAFAAATIVGARIASALGAAYLEMSIVIPVAIFTGLGVERLFMGEALADFITRLAKAPNADPQPLMAAALHDPSLQIGYRRRMDDSCVDFAGQRVPTTNLGPTRAISWVRRGHSRIAAVIYDAEMSGQDRFVRAAGAAALMRLERTQLEADLKASTANLAASRSRLVETADAERQRIERDLHDSIQQDLVGLRLKLDMVAEAVGEDPQSAQLMLGSLGNQMDDVLEALRSMARGVYPSLLRERGLADALRSAARRAPLPVMVDARALGRYPEDLETAVYFCCLEALQNAIKHAGHEATVDIRLREDSGALAFQVRDTGQGFDPAHANGRHGLLNMQDRTEAVGGALVVSSQTDWGTLVRGRVPVP